MSAETHYLAVFTSDKTGPKWRAWRAMSEAQQAETARLGVAAVAEWEAAHQDSIVFQGGPLGPTKRIGYDGAVTDMVNLLGASISLQHLAIIVVAFAAIGLLQWFVGGTRLGRQMQATAQNPTVARILGIPVERMVLLTFLLNAALAVIASLLISPIYLAKFSNGETIGLFAFIAAIVP